VVRDHSLDPTNLAIDRSGKLLVVSSYGPQASVYSIDPEGPKDQMTMIAPTPSAPRPGAKTLLPVNWWNNGEFRDQYDPATGEFTTLAEMFARDVAAPKAQAYVSRPTAACRCRPSGCGSRDHPTMSAGAGPIACRPTA
jgi:hypothetical protein